MLNRCYPIRLKAICYGEIGNRQLREIIEADSGLLDAAGIGRYVTTTASLPDYVFQFSLMYSELRRDLQVVYDCNLR